MKPHLSYCVSAAHFHLVSLHYYTSTAWETLGHSFAGGLVAALPSPLPTMRLPLKGYYYRLVRSFRQQRGVHPMQNRPFIVNAMPSDHYRQCPIQTALRSHGQGNGAKLTNRCNTSLHHEHSKRTNKLTFMPSRI